MLLILLFVDVFTIVEGHGYMTQPYPRGGLGGFLGQDTNPISILKPNAGGITDSELKKFVCHNRGQGSYLQEGNPTIFIKEHGDVQYAYDNTLNIDTPITLKSKAFAAHPGDCAWYISYDLDPVDDINKKWHLFYKKKDCMCGDPKQLDGENIKAMCQYWSKIPLENGLDSLVCAFGVEETEFTFPNIQIPKYFPPAEHAILRFEWYAIHLNDNIDRNKKVVEFYANCADVKLTGGTPLPDGKELSYIQIGTKNHIPLLSSDSYESNCRGSQRAMVLPNVASIISPNVETAPPTDFPTVSPTINSPMESMPDIQAPPTESPTPKKSIDVEETGSNTTDMNGVYQTPLLHVCCITLGICMLSILII